MAVKKSSSTITVPNPFYAALDTVDPIKGRVKELFMSFISESRQERISTNKLLSSAFLSRFKFNFNKKNIFRIIVPIVAVLLFVFLIRQMLITSGNTVGGVNTIVTDSIPLTTVPLSREFKFPLKDQNGKEVGKLSYNILSAELRKQIIVKGKRATVVAGRIFLIINLKIVNTLDRGLEVNSRDYIRISVDGKTKELFAPDIHNDPVEVQAISTKNTRVGLAIDESSRDIELQVGEINGEKTIIPVSFKK